MQQNYRQLGLHSIIKSQEAKIHQLKEQLRITTQRQQSRYEQFTAGHHLIIQQKDKIIQRLKKQLNETQFNKTEQLIYTTSRMQSEREAIEYQARRDKKKIIELQAKLQKLQNQHQNQYKQLSSLNRKLIADINQKNRNNNSIGFQLTQLSLFYKNAIIELPRRKQTLLWVDSLIKYMEKSDQSLQTNHRQLNSYIKTSLQSLRTELINVIQRKFKIQNNYDIEFKKILQQFKNLVTLSKQSEQNYIKENEHLWQNLKKEKELNIKQESNWAESELKKLQKKYQQDITELKNIIKNTQIEKKTLLLGFQELKNLYDTRQKTYKEQINNLKDCIQEMIRNAEIRQSEFQEEIKILGIQLQSISQRYYENIETPTRIINQNLLNKIQKVRIELTKIQQNCEFNQTLTQLVNSINKFISIIQQPEKINQILQKYIQQGFEGIQAIQKYIKLIEVSIEDMFTKRVQDPIRDARQMQLQMRILELKQKQNKSIYEISLLKKHNNRLQEYSSNLEKKMTHSSSKILEHDTRKIIILQKRVKELETQVAGIREEKIRLDNSYSKQLSLYRDYFNQMKNRIEELRSQPKELANIVSQVKMINEDISKIVRDSDKKINQVVLNLNTLNNLLVKPVQTFQNLVRQVATNRKEVFNPPNSTQRGIIQKKMSEFYLSCLDNYRNILQKRNQISVSISKHVNDLIKTIRQNLLLKGKNDISKEISSEIQKQNDKKNSKSKFNQMEKKLKELHLQRLKEHKQIVQLIQKLQSLVKAIQSKANTSKAPNNIGKQVQVILDKKITSLVKQINEKPKHNINLITKEALIDLQTKLKSALIENQGMAKQIAVLTKIQQINNKDFNNIEQF